MNKCRGLTKLARSVVVVDLRPLIPPTYPLRRPSPLPSRCLLNAVARRGVSGGPDALGQDTCTGSGSCKLVFFKHASLFLMLAPVVVLHRAFLCSSSAPARLQPPLRGCRRDEASRGAAPASLPRLLHRGQRFARQPDRK